MTIINLKDSKGVGRGKLKRPSFAKAASALAVDLKIEFSVLNRGEAEDLSAWGAIPGPIWAEDGEDNNTSMKRSHKEDHRRITMFHTDTDSGKISDVLEDLSCQVKGSDYKVSKGSGKYTVSLKIEGVQPYIAARILSAIDEDVEIHLEDNQGDLFAAQPVIEIEPEVAEEPVDEFEPQYKKGDLVSGNSGGMFDFYGIVIEQNEDHVVVDTLQDGSGDLRTLDIEVEPADIKSWIQCRYTEHASPNYYVMKAEYSNKLPTAEGLFAELMKAYSQDLQAPQGDVWEVTPELIESAVRNL